MAAAAAAQQASHIGMAFVQQYYTLFDSILKPEDRTAMAPLYRDASQLCWEKDVLQGQAKIVEKFCSLRFNAVAHNVKTVDSQPSGVNGVIVLVCGELRTDGEDHAVKFSHVFHIVPDQAGSYWIFNEVFRFNLGF